MSVEAAPPAEMFQSGDYVEIADGPHEGKRGVLFVSDYCGVIAPPGQVIVAGGSRGGELRYAVVPFAAVRRCDVEFTLGPIPPHRRW